MRLTFPSSSMSAALLGIAAMLFSFLAHAQITDINSAINKAGRQRMLSQRLAKAYLQVWQKVDAPRSQKILDGSIALFDRQLVELKNYAPTPEIRDTYIKLEQAWGGYKDVLIGTAPNAAGAAKVVAVSEEVLALSHQGTVQLERHSGKAAGRLVNIAGRQRMLSQRMAKFYQVVTWGVPAPTAKSDLATARDDFLGGLKELSAAPQNTSTIKEELELAQQQWVFFEEALKHIGGTSDRSQSALNVATSSERILEVMDRITGMYEKL